jgi:TetR/AcrR family transcriptional regulator, transcriptional repressor for nem operon
MARPKEFEREDALKKAVGIFSDHGYDGTSTEALIGAMGVSRQSLYDTFGDKWHLYLECLQRYTADSIGEQLRALNSASSPLKGIEAHLNHAVAAALADPVPKCLGISAICEFGRSNPEVTMVGEMASRMMVSALDRRINEAKAAGEVPKDVTSADASAFIMATLTGIKVAARAGASAERLKGIARMALRSLAMTAH